MWEEGQLRNISKDFLKNTPKSMKRNSKTWQMGVNEIKKLLQAKETTDKAKKQLTYWEKVSTNDIIKDLEYTLQQLHNVYLLISI